MRMLTLAISTAALAFSGAAAQAAPAQTGNAERPARAAKLDLTRAQAQARAEAIFARMDANQDGTISEADRAQRQAKMFDRLDADKNGSISRAEFEAMHAAHGARAAGKRAGRAQGARHGMMKQNGPISRQAFVERALSRFDRIDADRDGTATQAERKAAHDAMRRNWQARQNQG